MKKWAMAVTAAMCVTAGSTAAYAAGPNIRAVSDLTNAEGQQAVYTVHLFSPTTAAATATLRLNNGTASAGSDFSSTIEYSDDGSTFKVASNGAAAIRAGVSAFRVRVTLLTDSVSEGNETYSLSIIPGANLGNVTGYGAGIITNVAPVTNTNNNTGTASGAWTYCTWEGGTCSFSGTRIVKYGTVDRFVTRTITNGTSCSHLVFGDPAYGVHKSCWTQPVTASGGATVPTVPTTPTVPTVPSVPTTPTAPLNNGRTQIMGLAQTNFTVEAGQDIAIRMRFFARQGQFSDPSKIFAHLRLPGQGGISGNLMNHWLWVPTDQAEFNGYREYAYWINVPLETPPGTYTLYSGIAQGVPPYSLRMQHVDCVGAGRYKLSADGSGDTCILGTVTVTPRTRAPSILFTQNGLGSGYANYTRFARNGMYYAIGSTWR